MQSQKLKANTIVANRETAVQKFTYNENGVITEQQVEWKNYDAFGISDLRTRKKANETAVTGMDYDAMELDPVGLEVRSRQTNEGGGGTIDPEIPMLQNLPEPGAPGGDPDYHGAGGIAIGPLCDIGGPVAVLCGRIQFVDGFGRSGRFASLERNFYYSNQPTGYRVRVRELIGKAPPGKPEIRFSSGASGANPNQQIASDGESILVGYEWSITPIYGNLNFAGFLGLDNRKNKKSDDVNLDTIIDDKTLKEKVESIQEKCRDFLDKYFAILDKDYGEAHRNEDGEFDMGANFDRISIKRVGDKIMSKKGSSIGIAATYFVGNKRAIAYRPMNPKSNFPAEIWYGYATFAELLHHARENGSYRDEILDKAMKKMIGEEEFTKRRSDLKKSNGGEYQPGHVAHSVVNENCQ